MSWLLVYVMWPVNAILFSLLLNTLSSNHQKYHPHVSVKNVLQYLVGLCCIPSGVFSIHNFNLPGFMVNGNAPIVIKSSSLLDSAVWNKSRETRNLYKCTLWNKISINVKLTRFPSIWCCRANRFFLPLFSVTCSESKLNIASVLQKGTKRLSFNLQINTAEKEMLLNRAFFFKDHTNLIMCFLPVFNKANYPCDRKIAK